MTGSAHRSGLADGLREMMSRFPSGVAIVTSFDEHDRPWGMTCSSLCSATLDPPTLLVCLRAASPTMAAIAHHRMFAVNLLHARAQPAAELFASGTPHRFDLIPWQTPPSRTGPHLVEHAHTTADCAVARTDPVGDHVIVLGHVVTITGRTEQIPLLYGLRRYSSWSQHQAGR